MKAILSIIVCLVTRVSAFSQSQELQQLKLDLEKLAQFKLMLSEMKSGYQTLANGYNAVRDAGKANFNLHQRYLDGLLQVNPQVKSDPGVQRVYRWQAQIVSDGKALVVRLQSSGVFTTAEVSKVVRSCNEINDDVDADVALLATVLTPARLRMSDGERSDLVAQVDRSVQQQAGKLQDLAAGYDQLLALRLQRKRDMERLKKLSNG